MRRFSSARGPRIDQRAQQGRYGELDEAAADLEKVLTRRKKTAR